MCDLDDQLKESVAEAEADSDDLSVTPEQFRAISVWILNRVLAQALSLADATAQSPAETLEESKLIN